MNIFQVFIVCARCGKRRGITTGDTIVYSDVWPQKMKGIIEFEDRPKCWIIQENRTTLGITKQAICHECHLELLEFMDPPNEHDEPSQAGIFTRFFRLFHREDKQ